MYKFSGFLAAAVVALSAGCENRGVVPASAADAAAQAEAAEPTLAEQADAVRAGKTDRISVEHRWVHDADLKQLSGLDNLAQLRLMKAQLSVEGLATLGDLKGLQRLILGGTDLSDQSAEAISRLTNLKLLNIDRSRISDEGLAHLVELKNLELLRIGSSQITDAGLMHLQSLTGLKALLLQRARVTDAGLVHLKPLTDLDLHLEGNDVTEAGIARALPGMHVHF